MGDDQITATWPPYFELTLSVCDELARLYAEQTQLICGQLVPPSEHPSHHGQCQLDVPDPIEDAGERALFA